LKSVGNSYYDFCNFQILNGVKCSTLAVLSDVPRVTARVGLLVKTLELLTNKHNFQRIDVDGNHNVHINNPERIAPYIVRFLTTQKCVMW